MKATLLLATALLLVAGARAAVETGGGKPPATRYSKINWRTGQYQPLGADRSYTFYRLNLVLSEVKNTTHVIEDTPGQLPLILSMAEGLVYDGTTGAKVGTYNGQITVTVEAGSGKAVFGTWIVEFGGSSLVYQAGIDMNPSLGWSDHDMVVVGGKGTYLGATGEAQLVSKFAIGKALNFVYNVWVPKLPTFGH